MQIGEFANLCKTKISVLRHYDKEGLLHPDYIDRFTGYRYYSAAQAQSFFKITVLKSAGFSLSEIKEIISDKKSEAEILLLFEKKKVHLKNELENLDDAQKLFLGESTTERVELEEEGPKIFVKHRGISVQTWNSACDLISRTLSGKGYQRISQFRMETEKDGTLSAVCMAVKLNESLCAVEDDTNIPFEDDEQVVGKWQVIGEFAVKEDFYLGKYAVTDRKNNVSEIYFLPKGERYWCYGWTRGKLIIENGFDRTVNNYTVEEYDGQSYMLVDLKSYDYKRGGVETCLVLRKLDSKHYTEDELRRTDDIDIPFVNDPCVIGKWMACGFVRKKESFDPQTENRMPLIYHSIEFREGGVVRSVFTDGNVVESPAMQEWTKGYLLRKWTKSACAYEIRLIKGGEYLFLEWKSGDYIYGNTATDYYVFEREL